MPPMSTSTDDYLNLLLDSLTGTLQPWEWRSASDPPWTLALMKKIVGLRGYDVRYRRPIDLRQRERGLDWPVDALSMIGRKRMENVRFCVEKVLSDRIPGDFIETGVWRGGASIFMAGLLRAYGVTDRKVWLADSCNGLPKPDPSIPQDQGDLHWKEHDFLAVSLEEVIGNFKAYRLMSDQVQFLPGWFDKTLPSAPIERLAVLRLDGDMYKSTMDSISALYGKVSTGGFVIVDDYNIPGCRSAVSDFREGWGITSPILDIDGRGVYWVAN